jgi:oxygen-dependent protoporphyrinogen oxidase
MPEAVAKIFRSAARRSAAELDEQTAGVGLSIFGALWLGGDSRRVVNVDGGSGVLADAWQRRLGSSVVRDATVVDVVEEDHAVRVTYETADGRTSVSARGVVVAVPAPVARQIVSGLPPEVDAALATIQYGPFVCLGVVTTQAQPMPWDDLYAVTTPGLAFDMLFNHAGHSRSLAGAGPGGSFMCYAGGAPAQTLLDATDNEIRDLFLADLYRVLPDVRDLIAETVVQKWTYGNVFKTTGTQFEAAARWNERPGGRLRLAGDYFADFGGTVDKATESGMTAALSLLSQLPPRDPAGARRRSPSPENV